MSQPFLFFRCGVVKVINLDAHAHLDMTEEEACRALLAHADLIAAADNALTILATMRGMPPSDEIIESARDWLEEALIKAKGESV
mgnify:CR=1 FL=1